MQNAPAEVLKINPEDLEVANVYLQNGNIDSVANLLGVQADVVAATLAKKHVRAYINQVFFDLGYNNRTKMREAMDTIITRKFQDMEESDLGSSKDIADLLALSHKMTMDAMDKEIQLEKIREANHIRSQTNIQINNGSTRYNALLEKLIGYDDSSKTV